MLQVNDTHTGAGLGCRPRSAGWRYGPTPADADGRADRSPPATAPPAQELPWPSTPAPGDRPHAQPPPSSTASLGLVGPSTDALAMLPEVLTAREAPAILRVGRNQLYQAVGRGELGSVRIGPKYPHPQTSPTGLARLRQPPASQR
jgi:hypothetical protein